MSATPTTIDLLVLELLWNCLSTAPAKQKHPIFSRVLSSSIVVDQLLSSASLTFAPGLYEVLQSLTAPDVSFFEGLPMESYERRAIYLLVLEKHRSRSKIYIGSGTQATKGGLQTSNQYDRNDNFSVNIGKALKDRYSIANTGHLCWFSMPSAAEILVLRVFFVALEAMVTFVFWTLRFKTKYGYGMTDIRPWARQTLPYNGLCTHNPLKELPAGDHDLSAEEFEAQALEMVQQQCELKRKSYERTKRDNPAKFKARQIKNRRTYLDKHPDARMKAEKPSISEAVKEQRHYCVVCKHAFTKKEKLTKYLTGPKHAAKAALLEKPLATSRTDYHDTTFWNRRLLWRALH